MSAAVPIESDVVLRSGRTLHVRSLAPADREALIRFYAKLSPEALHARFFELCTPERAVEATPTDGCGGHFGFAAVSAGEIVGIAQYFVIRQDRHTAEVAFAIADRFHGCGVATRLLELLVETALRNDIDCFEAEVLSDNHAMLDVFLGMGFEVFAQKCDGLTRLSFPIRATDSSVALAAQRSETAAAASMRSIFAPRSIAVIGASARPGQLGHEIVRNLLATGFTGSVFAVNRSGIPPVALVPVTTNIRDVEEAIELAIVAVPAHEVETVVDDCIAKGVGAIVVISAGFAESGESGRSMERGLLDKVRTAGIRMVGPNCMGVLNTDPSLRLHATFSPLFPPRGRVAMSSQSGALGLAVLEYAESLGIGFSSFISVGNKADVSGNDLIQYWAGDRETDVILLYLESFGNPQKFAEIARRVSRSKPIVAVKAGRSAAGSRAAASHTGALAANDAVVDALFKKAGVIRTNTLEEMFDVAELLSKQPLPNGNRVAIVTNAGGPAILATDTCLANGLELAKLEASTITQLRSALPRAASVANPVDMLASANAKDYGVVLDAVLNDPNVDAVVVIYIPIASREDAIVNVIRDRGRVRKPLLATIIGAGSVQGELGDVPAFTFPERAALALAHMAHYAKWRSTPPDRIARFADINAKKLRAVIDKSLQRGGGWLDPDAVTNVLDALSIGHPETVLVTKVGDAIDAAMAMEFPVALKAYGRNLQHKTDIHGVKLNLKDEWSVCTAFNALVGQLGDAIEAVVVQKMAQPGVEMMIGAVRDRAFGHVIAAGIGGTNVEIFNDVALRLAPLFETEATSMIGELRSARMLRGFRGSPAVDEMTFRKTILRIAHFVDECPEVAEIDLNPVIVTRAGVSAVDARIRVEAIDRANTARRVAY